MIPVFDIKRQNKMIGKEIRKAIGGVINNGIYILGEKVREFEEEFAKYIGVKYAVGVGNGTDAISLALLALGLKPGDGVIMPANSYPSVFALTSIGLVPQLVDIDPQTFTIDPTLIEKAINKKTRAILPVHMFGQPADMEAIIAIGRKYKIPVVEDCAQAHGSGIKITQSSNNPINTNKPINVVMKQFNNVTMRERNVKQKAHVFQKVGSIGKLGCFSFYPTKNLGAFGDGGMVVTDDRSLADKVRLLRMYGEDRRYHSVIPGRNTRLDELQAAILLVKLKYLDEWNKKRRFLTDKYKSQFQISNFKSNPKSKILNNLQPTTYNLQLPKEADYAQHIYHLFVIRTNRRDKLKEYLEKKGIMTAIHYPLPVHLAPSMKFLGYKKGDFPQSEKACGEVLSLPMFPELNEKEVEKVVEEISKFSGKDY